MAEPAPVQKRSFLRRAARGLIRLILLIGVPAAAGIAGVHYYASTGRHVTTENAYVKSRKVTVSADVSARVISVNARDNQPVNAGDILIELDRAPFEVALEAAIAERDSVRQDIALRRAELQSARVDVAVTKERVRYTEVEYARQARLVKSGAGRAARRDEAHHLFEDAKQRQRMAEERVRELIVGLGGKSNRKTEAFPRYRQAQAKVDRAKLELGWTTVRAPTSGLIMKASLEAGEYVESGDPLFAIVDQSDTWIEVNLKETQLTHIKPGMAATVVLDAYAERTWRASVTSISPATGAEFALLPPQNASGNWVKVVQRLPLRLAVERDEGAPMLRAGMTASISIDTGRVRELPPLVKQVFAWTGGRR